MMVSVVSTETNSLTQNVNVGGMPTDIIYNDINDKIYVANSTSGYLTVINTSNYLPHNIDLNSNPRQLAFSKLDNYLFVATFCEITFVWQQVILVQLSCLII